MHFIFHRGGQKKAGPPLLPGSPAIFIFKIRGFPPPDHSGFGLFWIINEIITALCFWIHSEVNAVLLIKKSNLIELLISQILCRYFPFLSLARKTGTYIKSGKQPYRNLEHFVTLVDLLSCNTL